MRLSHDTILMDALPGNEYTPSVHSQIVGEGVERPSKYWRSHNQEWAVYAVSGNRVGETIIESAREAKTRGLVPLLVVRDNVELGAVADRYAVLKCHVACPIAGQGSLIPPIRLPRKRARTRKSSTRIPRDLLAELAGSAVFPRPIHSALKCLENAYSAMAGARASDETERAALKSFTHRMLRQMGFPKTTNKTPDVIWRLERAGWSGGRDHFFHSYQNFFFGLHVVANLPSHFAGHRLAAKLNWDLNSYHVWLLSALWHDMGYGLTHLEEIHHDVIGSTVAGDTAESTRSDFLKSGPVQEGLLKICALMARLLRPDSAQTGYLVPEQWPKRDKVVAAIRAAFEESVMHGGHGASSALLLYNDFVPTAQRLGPAKHDVLIQAVQLACASMPFHDVNFRDHLRESLGPFTLSTAVLPFAVLLAFVDSIQDDRRDLDGVKHEARFLKRILVLAPATVTAKVNKESLPEPSFLWKSVEARDVLSHLTQDTGSLYFKYPPWMVHL